MLMLLLLLSYGQSEHCTDCTHSLPTSNEIRRRVLAHVKSPILILIASIEHIPQIPNPHHVTYPTQGLYPRCPN